MAHMHEYGIGVSSDPHLAKRYYDMALQTSPKVRHHPQYRSVLQRAQHACNDLCVVGLGRPEAGLRRCTVGDDNHEGAAVGAQHVGELVWWR